MAVSEVNELLLQDGLPLIRAMHELCGYARQGFITAAPGESITVLSAKRLRTWLSLHRSRPTVLASKPDLADDDPITADHAYPVVGYNAHCKTITVVNVLTEIGRPDRTVTIKLAEVPAYFFAIVQGPFEYAGAAKEAARHRLTASQPRLRPGRWSAVLYNRRIWAIFLQRSTRPL